MIEEASGTSLYETKREQTTKVIEKKDSKLKEMESVSINVHPLNNQIELHSNEFTLFIW